MTGATAGPAPAPPGPHVLREYALIADGERGALVGPRGDISWLCFPGWDDPAVLSSLIGGEGVYQVTPVGRFVWGGYYEPPGLVWRSRWITDGGVLECREALSYPARGDRAVLLRRLVAVRGRAAIRVTLDLRAGFGRESMRGLRRDDDGTWRFRAGDAHGAWAGGIGAQPASNGARGRLLTADIVLEEGERRDLLLVLDVGEVGEIPDPDPLWQRTADAWRDRVPALPGTCAPRDAAHAYAVLTGLTSGAGGMVAAATTSLPERAGEGRNYDYRYAWIRDQSYAGRAVAAAGAYPLMDSTVAWVRERILADGPRTAPAYTAAGGTVPAERAVGLPGYPGGTDIVGNHVRDQFQLDVFGEALLLFAAAARHDRLEGDDWTAVEVAADAIAERWREPDAGIWELSPRQWTHSRLACASGLRAVSRHRPPDSSARRWTALADAIVADLGARAVHRSGRWQRAPDDERVDAALLLGALDAAVPADDPRSVATLDAVEADLAREGFVYRFRPDERPLGEAEGAFLLCGFWMALAREQIGDRAGALRWFERSRSACGPPGLLSEEFDVRQRQLRGNLPQAFVHALLLQCAVLLGPDDGRLHGF